MRRFDPEVVDTVWAGIEPLLPIHSETHPLGCHRPRLPDRDCFEVMLVRLVTGVPGRTPSTCVPTRSPTRRHGR